MQQNGKDKGIVGVERVDVHSRTPRNAKEKKSNLCAHAVTRPTDKRKENAFQYGIYLSSI